MDHRKGIASKPSVGISEHKKCTIDMDFRLLNT